MADIEDGEVDREVIMGDGVVIEVVVDEGVGGEGGEGGAREVFEDWAWIDIMRFYLVRLG